MAPSPMSMSWSDSSAGRWYISALRFEEMLSKGMANDWLKMGSEVLVASYVSSPASGILRTALGLIPL